MEQKKLQIPKPPTVIPKPPLVIPKPPKIIPKPPIAYTRDDLYDMSRNLELPQAVDLEQAIVGAMLVDASVIKDTISILNPKAFYDPNLLVVYKAIISLYNKNDGGVDLLTVSNELRKRNMLATIGGDNFLIGLMQKVATGAHVEFHSRIVLQKYMLRELISMSSFTIDQSYNYDPDVFLLMETIEKNITEIQSVAVVNDNKAREYDATDELLEKVAKVEAGEPPGIYTGLKAFDDWCGGFQFRELITIAARPGMGKTTATLSIVAKAAIEKEIPIAFFSLEMTKTDLKQRLAARGLQMDYHKIRQGKLDKMDLAKVISYYQFIDESNLILIDRITVHEKICRKINDLVLKQGVKMVVIDYVQLMKLMRSSGDRTSDLGTITRDLKALANELNIPIIIIAQLSRKVDDRPSKRPMLSDLKWAGDIEENSDTVIFILRMAYYQDKNGIELPPAVIGKTEWIVAKGRNIGTRDFWTFLDFNNFDFRSY